MDMADCPDSVEEISEHHAFISLLQEMPVRETDDEMDGTQAMRAGVPEEDKPVLEKVAKAFLTMFPFTDDGKHDSVMKNPRCEFWNMLHEQQPQSPLWRCHSRDDNLKEYKPTLDPWYKFVGCRVEAARRKHHQKLQKEAERQAKRRRKTVSSAPAAPPPPSPPAPPPPNPPPAEPPAGEPQAGEGGPPLLRKDKARVTDLDARVTDLEKSHDTRLTELEKTVATLESCVRNLAETIAKQKKKKPKVNTAGKSAAMLQVN